MRPVMQTIAIAAALAVAVGGCASQRARRPAPSPAPTMTTLPAVTLARFRALPEPVRRERIRLSRSWIERAAEIRTSLDRIERAQQKPWTVGFVLEPAGTVTDAVDALRNATGLDPANPEAWCDLADLDAALGRADSAHVCLERAEAASGAARAHEPELDLRIALASAWTCRDLGEFRAGLAWAARATRLDPANQEALLVLGLLQADVGELSEAIRTSYGLEPVEYPDIGMYSIGLSNAKSSYVARWVEAMAFYRAGDCLAARWAAEPIYPRRSFLPYARRYWNDMGAIHERCGEIATAGLYYAIAYLSAPYGSFLPTEGYSRRPIVFGLPDVAASCYATRDGGYLAGSRFAFVADKVGRCEAGDRACCDSALSALATCARFGIDTTLVVALRGRVRFAQGLHHEAERDLEASHAAFARNGRTDPETELRLGQIHVLRGESAEALPFLEAAVAGDSSRTDVLETYGAVLLETGDARRGRAALERALARGRVTAPVLFNIGLLDVRESRLTEAIPMLEQALALAPDDKSIASLLEAARAGRQGQANAASRR